MEERGADEERIHGPADGANEAADGVISVGEEEIATWSRASSSVSGSGRTPQFDAAHDAE